MDIWDGSVGKVQVPAKRVQIGLVAIMDRMNHSETTHISRHISINTIGQSQVETLELA